MLFLVVLAAVTVFVVVAFGLASVAPPAGGGALAPPAAGAAAVSGFDADYANLKALWSAQGVQGVRLHAQASALARLSDARLAALEEALRGYRAASRAGQDLAEVYALLAAKVRAEKKARALGARLQAASAPCLELDRYQAYAGAIDETVDAQVAYLEAVNRFVETHPVEAGAIELFKNETWPLEARRNQQTVKQSVALLKEVCG